MLTQIVIITTFLLPLFPSLSTASLSPRARLALSQSDTNQHTWSFQLPEASKAAIEDAPVLAASVESSSTASHLASIFRSPTVRRGSPSRMSPESVALSEEAASPAALPPQVKGLRRAQKTSPGSVATWRFTGVRSDKPEAAKTVVSASPPTKLEEAKRAEYLEHLGPHAEALAAGFAGSRNASLRRAGIDAMLANSKLTASTKATIEETHLREVQAQAAKLMERKKKHMAVRKQLLRKGTPTRDFTANSIDKEMIELALANGGVDLRLVLFDGTSVNPKSADLRMFRAQGYGESTAARRFDRHTDSMKRRNREERRRRRQKALPPIRAVAAPQ